MEVLKKLRDVAIGLGISVVVVELLFRLWGINYMLNHFVPLGKMPAYKVSKNKEIGYEQKPNYEMLALNCKGQGIFYKTNSWGFRDIERRVEKPRKITRIGCLGDSTTFGFWLNYEETYPFLLERELNKESRGSPKYEVWNMGTWGYTTKQEVLRLEEIIKDRDPAFDIVMLGFFPNDIYLHPIADIYFKLERTRYSFDISFLHAIKELKQFRQRTDLSSDNPALLSKMYSTKAFKEMELAFHSLFLLGQKKGFHPVIVIIPDLPDMNHRYYYKEAYAKVKKSCEGLGLEVIDIRNAFDKNTNYGMCGYHFNYKGNQLLAEKLAEYITKMERE